MKTAFLLDLPEEPGLHNPEIKKKTILRKGELPHIPTFGQVTFAPGQVIPAHSHGDIYEVFFIKSGTGFIRINDAEFPLKPGVCILIEPNEVHEIVNTGSGVMELLFFQVEV